MTHAPEPRRPRPRPRQNAEPAPPLPPDGRGHRFTDHPSEARVRVRGATLGDVAAEAGRALAVLHSGEGGGRLPRVSGPWRLVTVRSRDRVALLVDWLNELIFLAESEHWLPVDFRILEIGDTHLHAEVGGVSLPDAPCLVKAATLHGATVSEVDGGLEADVLLDV